MIATVPRSALLEKLKLCELVRPSLRIMFGALAEAKGDAIAITADNFSICCRCELPAKVEQEGLATFSLERLIKLLENATGDEVTIGATNAKWLEVKCGALASSLASGPASDFPQRPALPVTASFEIPDLSAVLEWLSPVVSDETRHEGAHFLGDGKTLRVESTDGRQLHFVTIESPALVNVTAPRNLIKLGKAFKDGGACTVETTERTIAFRNEKVLVTCALLESQFPDTDHIIPAPSDRLITIPKNALVNALEAAGAVNETNTAISFVNVSVRPMATTIRTDKSKLGSVESVIETPNPFEVDFRIDPERLLAALKHVDTDEARIQCEDSVRRACVRHCEKIAVIALMIDPPPKC